MCFYSVNPSLQASKYYCSHQLPDIYLPFPIDCAAHHSAIMTQTPTSSAQSTDIPKRPKGGHFSLLPCMGYTDNAARHSQNPIPYLSSRPPAPIFWPSSIADTTVDVAILRPRSHFTEYPPKCWSAAQQLESSFISLTAPEHQPTYPHGRHRRAKAQMGRSQPLLDRAGSRRQNENRRAQDPVRQALRARGR